MLWDTWEIRSERVSAPVAVRSGADASRFVRGCRAVPEKDLNARLVFA